MVQLSGRCVRDTCFKYTPAANFFTRGSLQWLDARAKRVTRTKFSKIKEPLDNFSNYFNTESDYELYFT